MTAKKSDKKAESKKAEGPKDALVESHYEDAKDKPDPDTVAQVQVIDEK